MHKQKTKLLNDNEILNISVTYNIYQPVVYFLINNGDVIYIGATTNIGLRLSQHKDKVFDRYTCLPCKNENEMYALEKRYIAYYLPQHNIQHNDSAIDKLGVGAYINRLDIGLSR